MSSGFTDKLYWRWVSWTAHCFKRVEGGGFQSLCQEFHIKGVQTQLCGRPPIPGRCLDCDDIEQYRRGKNTSMPEEKDFRKRHYPAINPTRISLGITLDEYKSDHGFADY